MVATETIKAASLIIFTLQNAAFVLLMRASKVMGTHYSSTVAVLVTEALKMPLSAMLLVYETCSPTVAAQTMWRDICMQPMDTLKISIPALLYTVQNNALFIAVEHLEAAVFQVTYQLKTLTTAVLTVVLLGRQQQKHQWFALILLTAGTALVQEPKKEKPGAALDEKSSSSFVLGLTATVVACLCSSFASVYLEKILVESKPSIWVRNIQLCLFTIPIAYIGTLMVDDKFAKEDGTPLHGFNYIVWSAIFTNAAGGMIVATVMKFAGNILRNFAQACAIIVGGFGSWLLFDFQVTLNFVVGVGLVILSIFIYGSKVEQLVAWHAMVMGMLGQGSSTELSSNEASASDEESAPMLADSGKGAPAAPDPRVQKAH